MTIQIGKPAPDLEADAWVRGANESKKLTLADFRGAYLILFFYSRDFGDICPDEIAAFARVHDDFAALNAKILGASTDSYPAHKAWFDAEPRLHDVRFPVLADSSHAVSTAYGVLMPDGAAARGTFIIDPDGLVLHAEVNLPVVGRNVDETLRVLRAIRTGVPRGDSSVADTPAPAPAPGFNPWLAKALPRLPEHVLIEMSRKLEPVRFRAGERVFSQGDPPDRFYIVAEGEAEVLKRGTLGKDRVIATLGPGEFFGEMGLVAETRRMATVRAKSDLTALAIDWDYFMQVMEASEEASQEFTAIVRARVR